jgi:nucleolar protein 4
VLNCTIYNPKQSRLIVRNLPFSITLTHLKSLFSPFGNVVDVNLPLLNGKKRGFAFVQFELLAGAKKAIEMVNGTKVLNRIVAVDFAVRKAEYEKAALEEVAEEAVTEPDSKAEVNPGTKQEDANDDCDSKSDTEMNEDDVSEAESNEGEVSDAKSNEDNEDEFIEIQDSDNDMELDIEVETTAKTVEEEEDCTLFVRNLSFATTEESLAAAFSTFGKLSYAKITVDKVTLQPRGTGFVKFQNKADADKCVSQSSFESERLGNDSPFLIDGRIVSVDVAVSRDIATKLTQASKLNAKVMDKRNTYLLREGVVFPESEAGKLQPELSAKSVDVISLNFRVTETGSDYWQQIQTFLCPRRVSLFEVCL